MRLPPLISLVTLAAVACTPVAPPDTQVPAAPTQQKGTVESDGTVSLSWTNTTAGDFARTLVARFPPGGSARTPEGTPAVGDPIGKDGVVIFLGADASFVDLTPPVTCGSVSYRLWSQNAQGRWSDDFASITLPAGATTPAPSQPVTQLAAATTNQNRTLFVTWVNPPTSSGFFQTSLVRKHGSAPANLTDGTLVLSTQGTAYAEALSTYPEGTRLFYAAFPCNTCGRCQLVPASVSFTVPAFADGGIDGGSFDGGRFDGGALDAGAMDAGATDAGEVLDGGALDDAGTGSDAGLTPSALTVTLSPDGQEVRLGWVNAANPALTSVRVTRALTETPLGGTPTTSGEVLVTEVLATQASERVDRLLPSTNPARSYTYFVRGCSSAACEPTGASATLTLTLKQALRGGGYTIFWRHASASICGDMTNLCPASPPPGQTCAQAVASTTAANWWKTCASDPPTCSTTARQLDPVASQNETSAIHGWFQTNGVTVSRVLTSEYCRCFTTAQQLNFGPTPESSEDLTYYVHDEAQRCPKTMALLNGAPASGTNVGMVSHAGFFCNTLDSLAWAEAAIYKPQPPSTQSCTTHASCPIVGAGTQPACVAGFCVTPLLIARVPALGVGAWSTLP